LKNGFPSSSTVPEILEEALGISSVDEITLSPLEQICTSYASIAGGAQSKKLLPLCRSILELKYKAADGGRGRQWERSLFHCSKWGSLSLLALELACSSENPSAQVAFFKDLFLKASDSVEACPTEGLLFLFDCIAISTKAGVVNDDDGVTMETVIEVMFAVLDASSSTDAMYVLDEICSILFNSEMLLSEARSMKDKT
jgi:hypothetical protein